MALQPILQEQIHASWDWLHADPQHTLTPAQRRAIYTAIGPRSDRHSQHLRAWLDILTAQRLFPLWQPFWSGDNEPERLIQAAVSVLKGTIPISQAEALLANALEGSDLSPIGEEYSTFHIFCICELAILALAEALGRDSGDDYLMRSHPTEVDVSKWCDAAGWAAVVIGGGTWHPDLQHPHVGRWDRTGADVLVRQRMFWEWWLTEAIPAAWQAAEGSQ
jgi:hypothetical protein